MSGLAAPSSLVCKLLTVLFRQPVIAPDAETGVARLASLSGQTVALNAWHDAVAEAVAAGLVADPVRLPAGALQCHWHLELTPAGVERVRGSQNGA